MTPHQSTIATRFLASACAQREPVVVALSGAHAYGFPSPDSDLDLKAIHVTPTRELLGLRPETPPIEHTEVVEGVELDYSSHELGMVLHGVIKGNGNFIERILGSLLLVRTPLLAELQPLVRASLSQRAHHHYRGFALNQRREAEKTRRAKKVLYVLRTTLTGTHLLRTGELVTDVTRLAPVYGFELGDLLEAKSKAEKQALDDDVYTLAVSRMDLAFVTLDEALAESKLPTEAPNVADLDAWLVETRLRRA
ncbi:nucleotidyltransferase [Deltaproteobacteria bacterium]|nr:nucleotidyltransferase [Deltaproteobacteria bacterium]